MTPPIPDAGADDEEVLGYSPAEADGTGSVLLENETLLSGSDPVDSLPPASALVAPFSFKAVVVDGTLSADEWDVPSLPMDAANTAAPGIVTLGSTASAADASAVVYLKHDADFLYIAVDVSDDQVVASAPNAWDADSVEVFLDHDNTRTANVGINRMQFDVAAGGARVATPGVPAGSWEGAAALRSGGYVVEYRISKSVFGLSTGSTYGIDIAISDVEPSAGVIGTRYWYFSTAEASTNESLWGQVTLAAADNQPPTVDAGPDQLIAWPRTAGVVSGSVTDDGKPNPPGAVSLTWSQVSGSGTARFGNARGAQSLVVFSQVGEYVLQLSASDGAATATDTVRVTVTGRPNRPPVVDAGPDQSITWPANRVTLQGTVTDDGLPNPPASVITTWMKVSGPGAVSFSNENAAQTAATLGAPGVYELQLLADDGEYEASDTLTVRVLDDGAMVAAYTTDPIVVDGVLDGSEWGTGRSYGMDAADTVAPGVVVQGTQATEADASATIYLLHDASYLYVAVDVSDDTVVAGGGNVWDLDCVELFLDHDNSKSTNVGVNRVQFDVAANGQTAATSAVPAGSWVGAAATRPGGYMVEFRIAKAAFGLVAGGTYGFDVAINDVEPAAGTVATRYWYFSTSEAATNESKWGELVLEEPVQQGDPVLAVDTDSLNFGSSDTTLTLQVWNDGGGVMNYTVSDNAAWVGVSPAAGESRGEQDTIAVTVDRAQLAAGTHRATVTVDAQGYGTAMVTVTAQVTAGALSVSPAGGLTGSGPQGGPFNPASQAYTLTNTGGSSVSWTAAKTKNWVTLSKTGGTLAAGATDRVTVSINSYANGLSPGTQSDTATFANTTNGTGNTTRAVALTVSSAGSYSPMQAASRTSGVAPLAVFFDAVASAGGVVQPSGSDYASQHYVWDFGDDPSATFSTTGRSKNTATGYVAAHVYENPGTYWVTLAVTTAGGQVLRYEQTITVTAFTGTTYYVSSSQGSDGNNGTSSSTPFQSWSKAMSVTGSNRRILFKRGDSWTSGSGAVIGSAGPSIIGAYGSGAKPVINITGTGAAFDLRGTDWRIMDLELVGPGSSSQVSGIEGSGLTRNLILRTTVRRFRVGIAYGWGGALNHAENTIADCVVSSNVINNGYVGGQKIAVLGSRFETPDVSHLLRVWGIRKGVINNNYMNAPGGDRLALKLHNEIALRLPDAQYIVVSENDMRGHVYVVSIAPQAWDYDERVKDVVFEKNTVRSMSDTFTALIVEAQRVTIRNNVFNGDGAGDWYTGMSVNGNDDPGPADHRIYNNTIYRGVGGKEFTAISAGGADVRNNLASAPSTPGAVFGTSTSNNLISNNVGFVNPSAGDFRLQTSSPARNAGITTPYVRESIAGTVRPQGGAYDLGATEQ